MPATKSPKTILITGCSSGFGLLTAARLASAGHRVIATMRNLGKDSNLKSELNQRSAHADIRQLDVTDNHSINRAVAYVAAEYGHLDVLVNNAGYAIGGTFVDLAEDEIRGQFETNFFGLQNLTREVIPLMRPRREGKIINLSSISGFYAPPALGAYSASKWAVESFSESLYYELKPFGIQVALVEPGSYKTSIFYENANLAKDFENPDSPYFGFNQHVKSRLYELLEDNHKDPEEVAALVEKLIRAKRMPFRSIPDWEGKTLYFLRKFLPFPVFARIIEKAFLSGFKTGQKPKAKTSAGQATK